MVFWSLCHHYLTLCSASSCRHTCRYLSATRHLASTTFIRLAPGMHCTYIHAGVTSGGSHITHSPSSPTNHDDIRTQCVSWISCFPSSLSQSHPLLTTPFSPTRSLPEMILSLAADPISHALVQRIQSGQFVKMRDLLADNIALLNQLSSLHGTVPLPLATVNRTHLREVPSLVSWLYCFNAYLAVRMSDPITRYMLAYFRLLIREALRHGGCGWMEYDCVFRKQLSIKPCLTWNTLELALHAVTILGNRTSTGTFCTICRKCDHNANHCALNAF